MNYKKYNELIDELIEDARRVSKEKGADYTVGSEDALENFKTVAKRTGLDPFQVLGIYMMKHQDAISNYIKTGGQSESEPIKMRIVDNINYLCLLWGLIVEDEQKRNTLTQKYYENKVSEKQRKATTEQGGAKTINFIPTAEGRGYKIYNNGRVGRGHTVVTESDGNYTIRYGVQEHGETERVVDDGASGDQLERAKDTVRDIQKKQK